MRKNNKIITKKMLKDIANSAQIQLEKQSKDSPKFGYYLGVMHLASMLNKLLITGSNELKIDYMHACKLWNAYCASTSNCANQISMDDICPNILRNAQSINKTIDELLKSFRDW